MADIRWREEAIMEVLGRIDYDDIKVGGCFIKIDVMGAKPLSKYQPCVTVIDDKEYEVYDYVEVRNVEDRGDYLYVGYVPKGKCCFVCAFGYTRIYKQGKDPYEFGCKTFAVKQRFTEE